MKQEQQISSEKENKAPATAAGIEQQQSRKRKAQLMKAMARLEMEREEYLKEVDAPVQDKKQIMSKLEKAMAGLVEDVELLKDFSGIPSPLLEELPKETSRPMTLGSEGVRPMSPSWNNSSPKPRTRMPSTPRSCCHDCYSHRIILLCK